jgi:hypothetical protein
MADDTDRPANPSRLPLGARPFAGHSRPNQDQTIETFVVPPFVPPGSRPAPGDPPPGEAQRWEPPSVRALTQPELPTTGQGEANDGLDQVRSDLDAELSAFTLRAWEQQRLEEPLPHLDESQSDPPLAPEPETPPPNDVTGAGNHPPDAGASGDLHLADESDVAIRDPLDREFVTASGGGMRDTGSAFWEAVTEATTLAEGAEVAVVLEAVARRVRNGEILVPRVAGFRGEAAVLAAVLFALLGDRA